jgi:hypothetical protein
MGGRLLDLADRYLNGGRHKLQREERHAARLERENHGGGAHTWMEDADFLRAKAFGITGIPDARCFTLQSVIRWIGAVEGEVAECGVRFGKSTAFLLEADRQQRHYHLFDSFEGLSEPSAEDGVDGDGTAYWSKGDGSAYWSKGDIAANETQARSNLARYDNVTFYRGWIPERFPEVADRRFALVHVDVDLHEPTAASLAFFWPRIVEGGVLVCDDYGFKTCPGARKAVDDFFSERGVAVLQLTTGQALAAKQRRI